MLDVVTIQGKTVILENRECLCGCGIRFKVLPTSPQVYARDYCRDRHLENPTKQTKEQRAKIHALKTWSFPVKSRPVPLFVEFKKSA